MGSVKLQEILDDPKNVFIIVSKVAERDGNFSLETRVKHQQVIDAIRSGPRTVLNHKDYLDRKYVRKPSDTEPPPVFLLEGINNEIAMGTIFMSNIVLAVKHSGVYLVRSKVYPTNIRVEI